LRSYGVEQRRTNRVAVTMDSLATGTDNGCEVSNNDNDNENNNDIENDNIQAIQAECSTMISLLKTLEKEEHDLGCQLEILAKEALLCGFQNDVIEPPIPKKRVKKSKQQRPDHDDDNNNKSDNTKA